MKRILILSLCLLLIPSIAFAAPTVSWDETIPADSEAASQGAARIREEKTQLREIIDADHVHSSSGSGATWGYHNIIHLIPTNSPGTASATAQILYTGNDGTDTEIFYIDDDNASVQITKDGLNTAALGAGVVPTTATITGANWASSGQDLAVADGGTNLSSYTAGDTLYASGATTLTKLAKGTALQSLRMNAGATAPEWGAAAFPAPTYDSGFTAITTIDGNNTFSWTTLGRLPFHIQCYFSTSNTGDGANVQPIGYTAGITSTAASMEAGMHSVTASSLSVRLKETPQYIQASDSTAPNMTTSHFLRVMVW